MMKKSTVLYAFLYFFLFVGWGVTPANADECIGDNHNRPDHPHCVGGEGGTTLEDLNCTADQIPKYDGAQWGCAADVDTDTNTNADTICMGGEVLNGDGICVDLDALQGQINALQAQVDALDGGLVVLDDNDTVVGTFIGIRILRDAIVALENGGHLFTLVLNKDRFRGNVEKIYFEFAGCTGLSYFGRNSPIPAIMPAVAVGFPSNIVYIEDPNGTIEDTDTASVLEVSTNLGDSTSGVCTDSNFTLGAIPALPVVDLDTLFMDPFRVEKSTN